MGTGIGTFLKCDGSFQKDKEATILMEDDCLVQIGASLYGLINIITKEQYNKFQKIELDGKPGGFLKTLNDNQTVLRIKFFGGRMYG